MGPLYSVSYRLFPKITVWRICRSGMVGRQPMRSFSWVPGRTNHNRQARSSHATWFFSSSHPKVPTENLQGGYGCWSSAMVVCCWSSVVVVDQSSTIITITSHGRGCGLEKVS